MATRTNDVATIRGQIEKALTAKRAEAVQYEKALAALDAVGPAGVEIRRTRGRPSTKRDMFMVSVTKRGRGRPLGSKNKPKDQHALVAD